MSGETPKAVLFVDDDLYINGASIHELEFRGYRVTSVGSAKEFLKQIKTRVFDIAIIDLMMPTDGLFPEFESLGGLRTGMFLAHAIKLISPETHVVIYSAYRGTLVPEYVDREVKSTGWITFVSKMEYGKLIDTVDKLCRGQQTKSRPITNLLDSLKLEPSFMGVGIDLKKLARALMKR